MSNTIPKLEPITETVRQLNPEIWPDLVGNGEMTSEERRALAANTKRVYGQKPSDWEYVVGLWRAAEQERDDARKERDTLKSEVMFLTMALTEIASDPHGSSIYQAERAKDALAKPLEGVEW